MEMAGAKFDEYEGNIKAMVVKEGLMMVRAALSVSCLCRSPLVVLSTANRRKRAATAHPSGIAWLRPRFRASNPPFQGEPIVNGKDSIFGEQKRGQKCTRAELSSFSSALAALRAQSDTVAMLQYLEPKPLDPADAVTKAMAACGASTRRRHPPSPPGHPSHLPPPGTLADCADLPYTVPPPPLQ